MKPIRRSRFPIAAILVASIFGAEYSQAASGADFDLRWSWGSLGGTFDGQGFGVGDVDGDGRAEILVPGCSAYCWVLLGKGGVGYHQIATSLPGTPPDLLRLALLPGSTRSVVLLVRDGVLEITSWESGLRSTRSLNLAPESPSDLIVADLDGDLAFELVSIDDSNLFVQDWTTGAIEATKHGFGGSDLALGNIDADSQPEVAVANGLGSCWVLDGMTLTVDWGASSGCGGNVAFANLTADASDEIVSAHADADWQGKVRAWDPPLVLPIFEAGPYQYDAPTVAAADLDGLPGDEILVGAGPETPWLRVLRGSDGSEIQQVNFGGVRFIGVGDTDLDGRLEIVKIGNFPLGALDPLYVLDGSTRAQEFASSWRWMQHTGFDAGDLDGDGDYELVTGGWSDPASSFDGPYAGAWIFDGIEGGEPTIHHLSETRWWNGKISEFRLADGDGDGNPDLCATYSVGVSYVSCYDGQGISHLWSSALYSFPEALLLADVAGDATPEVLIERHSSSNPSSVVALRFPDGSLEWQSPELSPGNPEPNVLCLGDLVGDSSDELLIASDFTGRMNLVEPATGEFISSGFLPDLSGVACGDLTGDGRLEVVAAREGTSVSLVDLQTWSWGSPLAAIEHPVYALALGDLLGDSSPELAVLGPTSISLLSPQDGTTLWTRLGTFGHGSFAGGFRILDVDGDDRSELVASTSAAIAVFGRAYQGFALLVDGFESGDTRDWSRSTD